MKPNCWWCCYPFEWESLHFPYDFVSNVFHTTGHFCSWGCMKAYAIERGKLDACSYITLMRKRMEGKIIPIRTAPKRYCLEMFGGDVTIEEFRSDIPITLKIPGEIYQTHIATREQKTESILNLKREKPLARKNGKLETSLGIIRKCHAADQEKR